MSHVSGMLMKVLFTQAPHAETGEYDRSCCNVCSCGKKRQGTTSEPSSDAGTESAPKSPKHISPASLLAGASWARRLFRKGLATPCTARLFASSGPGICCSFERSRPCPRADFLAGLEPAFGASFNNWRSMAPALSPSAVRHWSVGPWYS